MRIWTADDIVLNSAIHANENLESQSFYSLLGAHITADFGKLRVTAWGKNILDRKYNTFYFVSLSEKFFCPGAGARFGIKLDFEL